MTTNKNQEECFASSRTAVISKNRLTFVFAHCVCVWSVVCPGGDVMMAQLLQILHLS